jgi:hypothetical protein
MPGFFFSVNTLDACAMGSKEGSFTPGPSKMSTPSPQERRMILAQEDRPTLCIWAEASRSQRTWAAVANARAIDFASRRIGFALRHQVLTSRAAQTIV